MRRGPAAIAAAAVSGLLALTLTACGGDGRPAQGETMKSDVQFRQVALADAAAALAVVEASDAFGLGVLAGADRDKSVVFSPASAFVALAMLAEGATNDGAEELDTLLGSSGDDRSEAVDALMGVLARFEGDPAAVEDEDLPESPLLHLANNIVLDDQAQPAQAYLDRLTEFYDSGISTTDLASQEGRAVLDAWVREHTGGRIEKSAIEPDPYLYLVLQNAVLLAARWQREFDPSDTAKLPFTSSTGQAQTAQMMRARHRIGYAQVDGWTAIDLPYQEGFAARFVLPPVGTDPASIDATTMAKLASALATAAPSTVDVSLPRFDIRSRIDLANALSGQGLEAIFDRDSGSFERIATTLPLWLGKAVQQATITTGEQGTVAAAVTEIGVMAGSVQPAPEHAFVADRPFLMVVEETTTGWDLFQTVVRSAE